MKKIIFYKIPKGWRRSIPFTLNYFIRKFHRVECRVFFAPQAPGRFRVFGIKRGICPGRKLEVVIDNDFVKTLSIVLNDTIVYNYKYCNNGIDFQIEYTARDFLKQVVIVIPGEDVFIFKYATTEKINKLLTPRSEKKLNYNQWTSWEITL